jgi:hypothetical protein
MEVRVGSCGGRYQEDGGNSRDGSSASSAQSERSFVFGLQRMRESDVINAMMLLQQQVVNGQECFLNYSKYGWLTGAFLYLGSNKI